MDHRLRAAFVSAIVCAGSVPVHAGAPEFGYVYTAETEERGETEVSLWATDRRGKDGGHYDAQDYKLEVERGITNRFGVSAYAKFASHHIHGLGQEFEPVDRNLAFQGLSAEFKYKLLDPSHDRFGLTFYAEPGWSRISKIKGEHVRELEFELKAIVQKNFAHDRLVWAANLTLEPEREREHETIAPGSVTSATEQELAAEVSTGLSYNVARHWWVGAEGRYHSVYPDWTHGLHRENYAVYAGPTVHYDGGEWSVTATWQPQLFGGPGAGDRGLEFDDHEKREFRLKLSKEF
jgi:hypothetical protein